ncbi:MAG: DUF6128 domain-containing protein [Lachnospiraceae bacterium]|nr:DUF6128 domain-containing protein [Lachnospiraceae bacterium]
MTDYSRFIAYIYEYVNGIKQYNAGFTKVEVRNGICKIQLVIKNTGRESKVKIYGLVRTQGWLLGILLGEGQIQRQRLDVRIVTDSQKVGGSEYPFQKITGLFIQGTEGRTYATAWDEEPLLLEKFVTELPEEVHAKTSKEETVQDEDVQTEHQEMKVQIITSQETEIETEKTETKETETKETEEEKTEAEKTEMQVQMTEIVPEENRDEETEMTEIPHEPEMAQEVERREEQIEDSQRTDEEEIENVQKTENLMEERWQKILDSYSRVDPFEDQEFTACVQISPGDLATIWQKEWRLARNSFLLHGYYNYRHLILGRTGDGRWIVGVPGVYERQEHFVASRFGFAGFKPAKQGKEGERPFGYWCRVLC